MDRRAYRLLGLDRLRGAAMVLMALDHVRAFMGSARFDPTDVVLSTPGLFATRWVTHFVAPIFVLFAGTSTYLARGRRGKAETRRLLLTRGLWLVGLELTFVTFAWTFSWSATNLFGQVIFAIGMAMILLAPLAHLPAKWVGGLGVAIVCLHNLTDSFGVTPELFGSAASLWTTIEYAGPVAFLGGAVGGFVSYPVVPWTGILFAGYGLGAVLELPRERRDRILRRTGLVMIGAFFALRAVGIYGDYSFFEPQPDVARSVMSFLNASKYPPSLHFALMTLGPALLLLPSIDKWRRGGPMRALETFGRVPLFFYLLHLPVIHLVALALAFAQGLDPLLLIGPLPGGDAYPADYGVGLPLLYVLTFGIILMMWPACRWFADLKKRRKDWWLSYL